jgi:hypothetical protein
MAAERAPTGRMPVTRMIMMLYKQLEAKSSSLLVLSSQLEICSRIIRAAEGGRLGGRLVWPVPSHISVFKLAESDMLQINHLSF